MTLPLRFPTSSDVTPAFDLCGELPRGLTVLEASAGTGKTYTITALAARYVAEGIPLERILLVTFTRMATSELRERVRDRLTGVERGLAARAGGEEPSGDPIVELLAQGPERVVAERRQRIARALADFDAATIDTTHGFCQEVLDGLGIAGDADPEITLVESVDELLAEVVDDLYIRRFAATAANAPAIAPPGRGPMVAIASIAVANPTAAVVAGEGAEAEMRVRFALRVRSELRARMHRLGIMGFDDLLERLASTLGGPNSTLVATRLRERFDVVLVDEFQDTDPVQWEILRRAFGGEGRTMIVIADPKQAIYAFRGADVHAYLEAARHAHLQTLSVNRRSDQPLIDALDALFAGAELGHPGIVYRPVRAPAAHAASGLRGAPAQAPLRLRVVRRDDATVEITRSRIAQVDSARRHVAADLAADVARLLASGAQVRAAAEPVEEWIAVRPGHVAVLTRRNAGAEAIRAELEAAGIPAVTAGGGSVFATEAAETWRTVLEALERPASTLRVAAAALTPFLGWSAERLAAAGESELADLHQRLHDWARVMRTGGVAALAETITTSQRLPERLLTRLGGERLLTDLGHVAELLHTASTERDFGVTALAAWLRERIDESSPDTGQEAQTRRLESDAEAVQVMTVHRSKGLEFPIVYLPSLWEPDRRVEDREPVLFHDPDQDDRRTIDVTCTGEAYRRHRDLSVLERRGEELRLAYVALTRARHQAVVWWVPGHRSGHSSLGRLLFARAVGSAHVGPGIEAPPDDAKAAARLAELASAAPGRIAVETSRVAPSSVFAPPPEPAATLTAARFDRSLDARWRRTSYSDLTAAVHDGPAGEAPAWGLIGSEPEDLPVIGDEPDRGASDFDLPGGSELPAPADVLPLAAMGSGVRVGTLVHRVLETADFAAGDPTAELVAALEVHRAAAPADLGEPALVAAGLQAALATPLGPLTGGSPLLGVSRKDRLDELAFELPLAGGERPTGPPLRIAAVASLLREHLPADDPLARYPAHLADPALRRDARGYLTGSIDLLLRLPGPRFAIIDYKTNRLAPAGLPLTADHYAPAALAEEMMRSHYALQALLYLVAAHRFLRWRVAGYTPQSHLAGALYLFLRGMTGPGAGARGVFAWSPPPALITALSDLLDRGAAR